MNQEADEMGCLMDELVFMTGGKKTYMSKE
jgi:hypothetical protein